MARRQSSRPAPAWSGDLPVFERTLDNGLKALVLPRKDAPVVVCDLHYPVGSVDEPAGRSGLAHFVEHMLFKGTARFPKGQIDRLAFLAAGQNNAETGEDLTHYWFAFPKERWELALAVESDRMRGARFEPGEVESERHVIAEERARDLDSPAGRLDQHHLATSYLVHPYRNPILGWPADLRRTSDEDLRSFHDAYYRPDGAVIVVVGDLHPQRALDRIEAHFAPLDRGRAIRPPWPDPEPRQVGRREFLLEESEAVARGLLGWHTVPLRNPDGPALDVLADLLACGRRSRLWDRLVERGRLATWVDANQEGSHLAGQFFIQVEAVPGIDPPRLEAEILDELALIARDGPTPEEMARGRHRLEAAWRWEQEDVSGLAGGLGHFALWHDWRSWQADHRAALAVSADDVRRVAATYFPEHGLTIGWSIPRVAPALAVLAEAAPAVESRRVVPPSEPETPLSLEIPAGPTGLVDYKPIRAVLPNGLRLLSEARPGTGTVVLELLVEAGLLREAKPGLAHLTGRLREEGTLSRSAEMLAEAIEDVGGSMEIGSTGVSFRVRAEDLSLAIELMADLILRPAFPADSLSWTKHRIAAELQGDRDDPAFRAELLFRGLIYGSHPYARDPRGQARQIAALTLDDVRSHHRRFFRPDNAFLVAVGDFDPRLLKSLVKQHLGPWRSGPEPLSDVIVAPESFDGLLPESRPRVRRVFHPGEQVHLLMGHRGIARRHPDYDALCVLDHILGTGPGFTDRLSRVLRDELGLAYSVGGGMTDSADRGPGLLRVYVGTGRDEAKQAVEAATEQIRAMHLGQFSDEEVRRARRYLADSWVFDYQTVSQRADRLLELEYYGLPLDEPLRWPDRIARISAGKVRRAAKTHLHPSAMVRVEYGPVRPAKRR